MEATITEDLNVQQVYSCTFLNMLGDITIQWDEQNKEHVLEVIRRKMSEGYVFFTTKKYLFGQIKRQSEVTNRDLNRGLINHIVIKDEEFEKMMKDMNDPEIASLVSKGSARVGKISKGKEVETFKKAKTPEEVIQSDCVAIRPIQAG